MGRNGHSGHGGGESHLLSIYTANSQETLSNNPLVEVEGSFSGYSKVTLQ
jgi:hypothetical protein